MVKIAWCFLGLAVAAIVGVGGSGYLVTSSATGEAKSWKQEIFLLPEGYTGPAFLVYGVEKGNNPATDEGRLVYRIPQDGVFLSQLQHNPGPREISFFYRSSDGSRKKIDRQIIKVDDEVVSNDPDSIYVYLSGITYTRSRSRLDCDVYYREFWVGKPKAIRESAESVNMIKLLTDRGIGCNDLITEQS